MLRVVESATRVGATVQYRPPSCWQTMLGLLVLQFPAQSGSAGRHPAQGINFYAEPGSLTALMGGSGAGKTVRRGACGWEDGEAGVHASWRGGEGSDWDGRGGPQDGSCWRLCDAAQLACTTRPDT